ncbi:hypothetical protein HNY73_022197 [Argiope bruennichi]|uniref:Uncharacterized protein n=1 Tax=Argiope bruennichi TaxID=94029 RepID=A0A8T0E1F4_ARGBR|nr:hypothetical protein HNY73_022197 [Argiope bruennichi]
MEHAKIRAPLPSLPERQKLARGRETTDRCQEQPGLPQFSQMASIELSQRGESLCIGALPMNQSTFVRKDVADERG